MEVPEANEIQRLDDKTLAEAARRRAVIAEQLQRDATMEGAPATATVPYMFRLEEEASTAPSSAGDHGDVGGNSSVVTAPRPRRLRERSSAADASLFMEILSSASIRWRVTAAQKIVSVLWSRASLSVAEATLGDCVHSSEPSEARRARECEDALKYRNTATHFIGARLTWIDPDATLGSKHREGERRVLGCSVNPAAAEIAEADAEAAAEAAAVAASSRRRTQRREGRNDMEYAPATAMLPKAAAVSHDRLIFDFLNGLNAAIAYVSSLPAPTVFALLNTEGACLDTILQHQWDSHMNAR